jgi:hypothetical protein
MMGSGIWEGAPRPEGWTSTDAAGLPTYHGLVRGGGRGDPLRPPVHGTAAPPRLCGAHLPLGLLRYLAGPLPYGVHRHQSIHNWVNI